VFAFETDPDAGLRELVTLAKAGNIKAAKYLGFIYPNRCREGRLERATSSLARYRQADQWGLVIWLANAGL